MLVSEMMKNAEYGPDKELADTIDGGHHSQRALYDTLQCYSLEKEVTDTADYILVASIGGIDYYTPNDEQWGAIVAVSEIHCLARYTGFYEMDDMKHPGSDYVQVVKDGYMIIWPYELSVYF